MTLITRLFGKKLKNEELTNLMDVLNIDKSTLNSPHKWLVNKYWGRCLTSPNKDGINVDLYIFREDYHFCDGSLPELESNTNETKTYHTSEFHYKQNIPFNRIIKEEKEVKQ